MNLLKNILLAPVLKQGYKRNLVSGPEVINLEKKSCIGYSITTSLKRNRKKKEIPPFFHDIYDNNKLNSLWEQNEQNMYCIFDMHPNSQNFDYYIATDKKAMHHSMKYAEITLPKGKYVRVELMKRNHSAVSNIMMYLRAIWLEANGYKAANSPAFILYDERFHSNYKQHGCIDGNYPGKPIASFFIPLEDEKTISA
ncbi:GyrI-like domain-containing protein [Maribellus maritimus]|uniref:GyrI-like domain-containing protein n=1 Tax=Maribellus maritimus TaxID=2870838 RepID=UPI001EEB9567|nr:GyrI-like domain-containing protein [Maribellus maritimus]MCG6187558.1 GyrI-like domain-containing protein [Maribellus maritimus]